MNPATRKTLLRVLLAISLYASGDATAGWYCLPKKYKSLYRFMSPMMIAMERWVKHHAMEALTQRTAYAFRPGGSKIGDTVILKRPPKFVI